MELGVLYVAYVYILDGWFELGGDGVLDGLGGRDIRWGSRHSVDLVCGVMDEEVS